MRFRSWIWALVLTACAHGSTRDTNQETAHSAPLSAAQHYSAAQASVQKRDFKAALPHAKQAVTSMKGMRENWVQFLISIHFELGDNKAVVPLLKRLIKHSPEKKAYWLQLSATYSRLNDMDKALSVLELAYAQGMLTDQKGLLTLARLYYQAKIPKKAAQLIEKHLGDGSLSETPESLELLAASQLLSQELNKARSSLDKAAKAQWKIKARVQLARIHYELKEWVLCKEALENAIEKGPPWYAPQLLLQVCSCKAERTEDECRAVELRDASDRESQLPMGDYPPHVRPGENAPEIEPSAAP